MFCKYLKKICVIISLYTALLISGCDSGSHDSAENGGDGDSSGAGNPIAAVSNGEESFDNATFENARFQ